MVIAVLSKEVNESLGMTLGVLNSCGFETCVVKKKDLNSLAKSKKVLLLGKHPNRKHNGKSRRRFDFYQYENIQAIGYVKGAEKKVDVLWWRDLSYKIRDFIEELPKTESLKLETYLQDLRKKFEFS